jgi:hypothetical protein
VSHLLDLHLHTRASGDNDADPEEMVVRAVELGLEGLAFTEHQRYAASDFVRGLRERHGGSILILRGVELSCAEGHCLVFGVDTDPLRLDFAPLAEVAREVGMRGGATIPSHPYRPGTSVGDLVRRVPGLTALEGCNGANLPAMNQRAIQAARSLGLPHIGGSDAHAPREVGSCLTDFSLPVTLDNFVSRLREGAYHGLDRRRASRVWIPGEEVSR